ncbi:hypothetical protein [Virgisporangium aliadipatigenens]|uniref:hypothetical protein n=1 Tax=Virgisporangium aliadipatigenens TaxID=741659 RepID=UPI00194048CF|nr:hypothetical protein [Virgisporangium aliadipatigenens]
MLRSRSLATSPAVRSAVMCSLAVEDGCQPPVRRQLVGDRRVHGAYPALRRRWHVQYRRLAVVL